MPGGVHVPNTNSYRWPEDRDPLWAADQIADKIEFEGPDTVAAVILEPVQNSGGCFTPQDGYFQRVREICDEYGVLLISDEVICSWGRLGHYFGCERYGYQPDIITTAKGLTSAYAPMGAVIASDRVAEPFIDGKQTFTHGITFGGHPVSAAVAMANLDVFEREDLCGHVRAKEGEFRGMLERLREDLPIVGDVRGAGYFQALELVKDKETKESFGDEESEELLRGFLSGELFKRGLICRADDRGDPVIQLSPPLIADTEQFEEIDEVLRPGAHRGLGPDRSATDPGTSSAMLTVRVSVGDGPRAGDRRRGRRRAGALGAHHRAARPDALAVGRRAAADHRHPARHEKRQREFVRRLADHHLAGLGFGTGFDHDELPKALVDEAEKLGFPVFEVPYELPFIAITEKAFTRLVNEQYEVLQRGIAIHKRLERLVLEERGLDEVVRALAAAIGGAVVVLSSRGETLASGRRSGRPLRRLLCAEDAGASAHRQRAGDRRAFAPDHPDMAGRALALPGRTANGGGRAPQAWLVAARDGGGLGDFERLILQQAVTVVALELMRQRAMRDTERRLAGDVLAEALTGRLTEPSSRRRLTPSAGRNRGGPVGVSPRAAAGGERGALAADMRASRPARPRRGRAPPAVRPVVAVRGARPWRWPSAYARARCLRQGPSCRRAGRAVPPAPCDAFHEARCALEARRSRRGHANGSAAWSPSWRDLGAFLLLSLQDDEALRLYCDSVLGPIERGDGEYGGELIRSLEAFIEQNGQWERAARELYCHRHTLRYRIRRVEELTGRDLSSARDRIEFWLALRGRELVVLRPGRASRALRVARRGWCRRHDRAGHRARPGRVRRGR